MLQKPEFSKTRVVSPELLNRGKTILENAGYTVSFIDFDVEKIGFGRIGVKELEGCIEIQKNHAVHPFTNEIYWNEFDSTVWAVGKYEKQGGLSFYEWKDHSLLNAINIAITSLQK
jgi:hypothetical protein